MIVVNLFRLIVVKGTGFSTWELEDKIICLWCGKENNRVWSMDGGMFPKYRGLMKYENHLT